jgi:Bacterial Ig domain/Secretion system C-terminal sorting domain
MPSNNIRTIISIKIPYPGMRIVWDEWEDGYETSTLNPTQATTKVWGDGDPFNGIAPGFPTDIIPAGGSIVLDNTMIANPRNSASIFYDGKDKIVSSGQIAMTQVSCEPSIMSVQAIKTNVTSTYDFGQSFTIPLGEDFPSRDFDYTALFIRASENNTTISIDKDNNGTFETTATLNEGGSYLVNGGVLTGATVASDKPVGVELNAGGIDNYSIRNAPIYPATWYSNTYYTPVPTSDNAADNPKDSSVVMFYNSLNRSININWYSGAPANGVITVPAKSAVRFPLAYSTTAAYKFVNLTGESFTAIEIVNSYSPGGGGTAGQAYDWSFNLISEARLTDYTTVAWAPGGLDLVAPAGPDVNGNPIWVTPTANTTIYVKYNGDLNGTAGLLSPCGLRYDVSYNVNALEYIKIKDPTDNDQGGIAIYTCNGAKIAAVYGEDPMGSTAGSSAYWDVGSTIQPFCKEKLVIATDDYATTLVNQPVTITILDNDFGFLATIDPSNVSTLGLLQPLHGTVSINSNGTILYIPNSGFSGLDTFEYRVCSTPSPIVCDMALVVVRISTCPSNGNQNVISGQVFTDRNKDAVNNDGGLGLAGVKVYLYTDGNCSGSINANELTDSVTVDTSGFYQFTKYPEKSVEDNFDDGSGGRTCANGTDGDSPWSSDWTDAGDPSTSPAFCNTSQSAANTDVEIMRDGAFGFGLRLKDNNVSARRSVNLNGAIKAFLTFSYRRKSATLASGDDILVQVTPNGSVATPTFTTIYTIAGNGTADANYVTVYNQDITSYATANTAIRFLTNNNVSDADTVYIDNVSVIYLKYPQCYITSIAASSVPANYTITTAAQNTVTINSGGTCTSQFDFGFGKPNITISGTLYNDKDGLVDGLVNGAAIGSPGGATVYAYLTDMTGKVAFKTTVNSGTGAYSFPLAEIYTDYTLILSTTSVPVGATPPSAPGFAVNWITVGDAYGTNNGAGSGNKSGTPNVAIAVKTAATNVTNVNFGIQRLPDSDNKIRTINHPTLNQLITLDGAGMNPPVVSGSDPEDCTSGCVLTTRSVIIDQVPGNSEMYYNGVLVTSGQQFNNFNPSLLQIKVTAAALGDTAITFNYSFVDAAMFKDPSPATYTLIWLIALPANGLTAMANLNGNIATIKWNTISEQNTHHFIVERSIDNRNFTATGNQVPAAGSSDSKRDYQMPDNITSLMQKDIIYYRIKLVDIDGQITYSNVVAVRLSKKPGVTIWPNPFLSAITISITTERETIVDIKLIDVSGKLIRNISQSAAKGISQIAIQDLGQLPGGVYLVEITDKNAGTTYQKLLKNNK